MVNYECLQILGRAAGYEVVLPPQEWLGTPWRLGEMAGLGDWLGQIAPTVDCLIVAVDTLGYGGLVHSRRSTDSAETVLARLEGLRRLKQERPQLTILGYNVLMRISRSNSGEEEKPYWRTFGARLFRLSVLSDRVQTAVATAADRAELTQLEAEIPVAVLADYRAGRQRNHMVNEAMIEWAAEGVFDYLIIPQDDTVEYGWNIAEARTLRQQVVARGLSDRVSIYPGTDEIDMVLLARFVAQQAGFAPTFWTRYSSVRHGQVITSFEDRPMEEVIKAQLEPLGGVLANTRDEADILLYVNAPAEGQGNGPDQYGLRLDAGRLAGLDERVQTAVSRSNQQPGIAQTLREMHTPQRNLVEFCRSLARELAAGRVCAVVDVVYVNAGDWALGQVMPQFVPLAQLAAYGGWNTAGNTLGTVLAHAVIRYVQQAQGATAAQLAAHVEFLFLRLVEDLLYMAELRSQLMLEELPLRGLEPTLAKLGEAEGEIVVLLRERLAAAALALAESQFVGRVVSGGETAVSLDALTIADAWLPWGRLFDLSLRLEVAFSIEKLSR